MNTNNNTVLITGGSAGIGFEMARLLSQKGNHVIILGRNEERLFAAATKLQNVTGIVCDVTRAKDVEELVARIEKDFPQLNMLINNAGKVRLHPIAADADSFDKAADEMLTNYLSVINLTDKLLPVLRRQPEAAIVNVSSVVALVPAVSIATYSASKAALHSYTQSLRISLGRTSAIKVFELMPPLVNTEFSKEIGGANGMAPEAVAENMVAALENDVFEIHPGVTAQMYQLSLSSPAEALKMMNA